jgi:hypothetical protein
MKVENFNKIMVIQWTNEQVRTDIGDQKIEVDELIRVLQKSVEGYKRDYGDMEDDTI